MQTTKSPHNVGARLSFGGTTTNPHQTTCVGALHFLHRAFTKQGLPNLVRDRAHLRVVPRTPSHRRSPPIWTHEPAAPRSLNLSHNGYKSGLGVCFRRLISPLPLRLASCGSRALRKCVYLMTSRGPWPAGPRAPHECVYLLTLRRPWRKGPRAPHKGVYLMILPGSLA
jgi:hypothetical protein